jgi:hypothetical protein
MTIGEKIKRWLLLNERSSHWLARKLDIPRTTFESYVVDGHYPPIKTPS